MAAVAGNGQPHQAVNVTMVSAEAEVNWSYRLHNLAPGHFCLPQPYQRAQQPETPPSANSEACDRPAKRARKSRTPEAASAGADAATAPDHEQPQHAQHAAAAAETTAAAMAVISRAQELLVSGSLVGWHCVACANSTVQHEQTSDVEHGQQAAQATQQPPLQLPLQPQEEPHQTEQQQQQQQQQQQEDDEAPLHQKQQQRQQQRQERLKAGDDVNWVALATLAHVLKPKLTMVSASGSNSSCNLFNTLIANSSATEVSAMAHEAPVLLPARSRFLMSDDRHMAPLLQDVQRHGGYHLLVLDPPWENASVRRGGQYATLPPKRLLELPVAQLLHQAPGSLVALWMTNRPRQHRLALEQLLPAWGLKRVAVWWWLKVTCKGEPVTPLSSLHRHPYEQLWLARPIAAVNGAQCAAGDASGSAGEDASGSWQEPDFCTDHGHQQQQQHQSGHREQQQQQQRQQQQEEVQEGTQLEPPQDHALVCVPGAHSVKPHLGRLLAPFVAVPRGQEPRRCELFARGMAAGWTSWGNEVLALQGCHMFQQRASAAAEEEAVPTADSCVHDAYCATTFLNQMP